MSMNAKPRRSCCEMLVPLEEDLRFLLMEIGKTENLEEDFTTKHDRFTDAAGEVYHVIDALWTAACRLPDTDTRRRVCFDFVSRLAISWQRSETKILYGMQGVDLVSHTSPPVPLRDILRLIQTRASAGIAVASGSMLWDSDCLVRFKQIYAQIIQMTSRLLDGGAKLRYYIYFLKATPIMYKKRTTINNFFKQVLPDAAAWKDAAAKRRLPSPSRAPPLAVAFSLVGQILYCPVLPRPQDTPLDLSGGTEDDEAPLDGDTVVPIYAATSSEVIRVTGRRLNMRVIEDEFAKT